MMLKRVSMLSKSQEKVIKSLHTKKGREKHNLCLVEGQKVIELATEFIDYTFTSDDSDDFNSLITTETPQAIAAVARIPEHQIEGLEKNELLLVADGVQDPGNIGALLRLCLAFNASLLLIESADVTSSKVIRSSAGAMFQVPWVRFSREEAESYLESTQRSIYRLEKREESKPLSSVRFQKPLIFIAGSEGQGIHVDTKGDSVYIEHQESLESLNVANATAIALHHLFTN